MEEIKKTDAEVVLEGITKSQESLIKELGKEVSQGIANALKENSENESKKENEVLKSQISKLEEKFADNSARLDIILKSQQDSNAGISPVQQKDQEEELISKSTNALIDAVGDVITKKIDRAYIGHFKNADEEVNKSIMNTFNNGRFGKYFINPNIKMPDLELNKGNYGFLSSKVNTINFPYGANITMPLYDQSGLEVYALDEHNKSQESKAFTINSIMASGVEYGTHIVVSKGVITTLANGSNEQKALINRQLSNQTNQLLIQAEKKFSKQIFSGDGSVSGGSLKGVQGIAKFIKDNMNSTDKWRRSKTIASKEYKVTREDLLNLIRAISPVIYQSKNVAMYLPQTLIDQFSHEVAVDGHDTFSETFLKTNDGLYFKTSDQIVPIFGVSGRTTLNQNEADIQDFLQGFEDYESFTSSQKITTLYENTNSALQSGKIFGFIGDLQQAYTFGRGAPRFGSDINGIKKELGHEVGIIGYYQEQFGMVTNHNALAIGYVKA